MAKKKPHLRKSKLTFELDAEREVDHTKKYPLQDGMKVYKTTKGYEVAYQERGVQSERMFFVTKNEAENYLKRSGRK